MTDPTTPGGPFDGDPDAPVTGADADDAINTESVNDTAEVAPEQSGAAPAGEATPVSPATSIHCSSVRSLSSSPLTVQSIGWR